MIDCGEPFYITPAEVDALEGSGELDNIALQIKDLIDIYDKCLESKK